MDLLEEMQPSYLLQKESEELGTPLSPDQISLFLIYLSELKRWNKRVNLTSIREDREIIIKHFLDSLSCLKGFIPRRGLKIIDIGTGAGFPGLPIKIYAPFLDLTLLEPSKKRVAFLHNICGRLGIRGVRIINERLEVIAEEKEFIGGFDVILLRGVGNIGEILERVVSLLTPEGRVILFKGKRIEEDLKLIGKRYNVRVINLLLPSSNYERNLIYLSLHR